MAANADRFAELPDINPITLETYQSYLGEDGYRYLLVQPEAHKQLEPLINPATQGFYLEKDPGNNKKKNKLRLFVHIKFLRQKNKVQLMFMNEKNSREPKFDYRTISFQDARTKIFSLQEIERAKTSPGEFDRFLKEEKGKHQLKDFLKKVAHKNHDILVRLNDLYAQQSDNFNNAEAMRICVAMHLHDKTYQDQAQEVKKDDLSNNCSGSTFDSLTSDHKKQTQVVEMLKTFYFMVPKQDRNTLSLEDAVQHGMTLWTRAFDDRLKHRLEKCKDDHVPIALMKLTGNYDLCPNQQMHDNDGCCSVKESYLGLGDSAFSRDEVWQIASLAREYHALGEQKLDEPKVYETLELFSKCYNREKEESIPPADRIIIFAEDSYEDLYFCYDVNEFPDNGVTPFVTENVVYRDLSREDRETFKDVMGPTFDDLQAQRLNTEIDFRRNLDLDEVLHINKVGEATFQSMQAAMEGNDDEAKRGIWKFVEAITGKTWRTLRAFASWIKNATSWLITRGLVLLVGFILRVLKGLMCFVRGAQKTVNGIVMWLVNLFGLGTKLDSAAHEKLVRNMTNCLVGAFVSFPVGFGVITVILGSGCLVWLLTTFLSLAIYGKDTEEFHAIAAWLYPKRPKNVNDASKPKSLQDQLVESLRKQGLKNIAKETLEAQLDGTLQIFSVIAGTDAMTPEEIVALKLMMVQTPQIGLQVLEMIENSIPEVLREDWPDLEPMKKLFTAASKQRMTFSTWVTMYHVIQKAFKYVWDFFMMVLTEVYWFSQCGMTLLGFEGHCDCSWKIFAFNFDEDKKKDGSEENELLTRLQSIAEKNSYRISQNASTRLQSIIKKNQRRIKRRRRGERPLVDNRRRNIPPRGNSQRRRR